MSISRIVFLFSVATGLVGCSGPLPQIVHSDPASIEPPANATLIRTLKGTGTQQFRCTADDQGRYWRFIAPKVTIKDKRRRTVMTQGAGFIFSAPDGSKLAAEIVAATESSSPVNLKPVLFKTTSIGTQGSLSDVVWIKRHNAIGGVPQTVCSASQVGMILNVRFSADYSLYR